MSYFKLLSILSRDNYTANENKYSVVHIEILSPALKYNALIDHSLRTLIQILIFYDKCYQASSPPRIVLFYTSVWFERLKDEGAILQQSLPFGFLCIAQNSRLINIKNKESFQGFC